MIGTCGAMYWTQFLMFFSDKVHRKAGAGHSQGKELVTMLLLLCSPFLNTAN